MTKKKKSHKGEQVFSVSVKQRKRARKSKQKSNQEKETQLFLYRNVFHIGCHSGYL